MLGLLALPLSLLVGALSTLIVSLRAPKGGRFAGAGLHLLILLGVYCTIPWTSSLGSWIWEKRILRPRLAALRHFAAPPSSQSFVPVTVDGYTFAGCERTPEGTLFYIELLGGPFSSRGIFVPDADDYRGFTPPREGRPRMAHSVTPTSVPGLFWLVTKD